MFKFITTLFLVIFFNFSLVGCHMYRPDIQQGNVIVSKNVNKLRLGMSQATVKSILGNPILIDTFTDNRLSYIYNYKHGNCPTYGKKERSLLPY